MMREVYRGNRLDQRRLKVKQEFTVVKQKLCFHKKGMDGGCG
jgi:hypothetical protein